MESQRVLPQSRASLAQAAARATKLRSVARRLANATQAGYDQRALQRRARLIDKLNRAASQQDQAAAGDLDEDPGHLAASVDQILDEAIDHFQAGEQKQGVDLVVGAAASIDALLEALGVEDSDEVENQLSRSSAARVRQRNSDTPAVLPGPAHLAEIRQASGLVEADGHVRKDLVRALDLGFRQASAGNGMPILSGFFSVYDQWAEIDSFWEGTFMETFQRGCFAAQFEESDQIRVLFQHGRDPICGSKPLGPITMLEEQEYGAYYEAELLDTSYVSDLLPGLRANLYGASMRFSVIQELWNDQPKASDYNPRGLPERTVLEAGVAEFGPVTFPAYVGATAGLRSLSDWYYLDPAAESSVELKLAGRVTPPHGPGNGTAVPNRSAMQQARDRALRLTGVIR
jgi:HK97 family phage prohead protease